MVHTKILHKVNLGITYDFYGYAYFLLKLPRKTYAAAFKSYVDRILVSLPQGFLTGRGFIIIFYVLPLLLLLYTS